MEHLLDHFKLVPLIEIHLFGIDFSITKAIVMMWLASILLIILFVLAGRRSKDVPSKFQNFFEVVIQFLRDNLSKDTIDDEQDADRWFPLIASLFLFILTCNLLGLVPGSFTATSNINVTAGLALLVFFLSQGAGIVRHGPWGYFKTFIPPGVPTWILPLMLPVEILSQFAKPFSLAVRLFANMLAGHVVILVFLSGLVALRGFFYIVAPLPLAITIVMNLFEIFVAFIQAYIFAILTAVYLNQALHPAH
jgi:F-type H+-transporting ATPase subunit a